MMALVIVDNQLLKHKRTDIDFSLDTLRETRDSHMGAHQ